MIDTTPTATIISRLTEPIKAEYAPAHLRVTRTASGRIRFEATRSRLAVAKGKRVTINRIREWVLGKTEPLTETFEFEDQSFQLEIHNGRVLVEAIGMGPLTGEQSSYDFEIGRGVTEVIIESSGFTITQKFPPIVELTPASTFNY